MNLSVKRILHWSGSALALIGIVFVSLRLNDYSSQLDFTRFDIFAWSILTILALVYGLANIMLALAWWNLLAYFGATNTRLWAVRTYGLTQLAKYVPGNIMHLASRQAMGLADGVRGWSLAKSSIWELGLITVTGAFFIVLALPQFLPDVSTPMATVAFVGVFIMMVSGLTRYIGLPIARAVGWYTTFLIVSGMIFVGLLALLMGGGEIAISQVLPFCGAFVVAWILGLVTPGAPAGVGVRELVLMVLLRGRIDEADLLMAVLLSRVVTVAGDVLFFLLASLTKNDKLRFRCE